MTSRWSIAALAAYLRQPVSQSRYGVLAGAAIGSALFVPFAISAGYRPLDLEVAVSFAAGGAIGAIAAALGRLSTHLSRLLLALIFYVIIDLYFVDLRHIAWAWLLLAGCVCICYAAGSRVLEIAASFAIVTVAATIVTGTASQYLDDRSLPRSSAPANSSLPPILHVIFDEHAGNQGFPADIFSAQDVAEFEGFFTDHGFRLYADVRSRFAATDHSLPWLLSLGADPLEEGLVSESGTSWRLKSNRYFEALQRAGYRLDVIKPKHVDACAGLTMDARCRTYNHSYSHAASLLQFPIRERLALLTRQLHRESYKFNLPGEQIGHVALYRVAIRKLKLNRRILLNPVGHVMTSQAIMPHALQALRDLKRGQALYLHLLMPHYPYLLAPDCQVRPYSEWLSNRVENGVDTPETRRVRFRLYKDQLLCARKNMKDLLAVVDANPAMKDALVIFHGDHGSRIWLGDNQPHPPFDEQSEAALDLYATLFAVRAPGIEPAVSRESQVLDYLFRKTIAERGLID